MLEIKHVTVRYGNFTAVDDMSFTLEEGMWLMLVGPNGAGKSTLIEAVSGGVIYDGKILLNGKDLRSLKPAQRARKIGVLAQRNLPGYAFTVEEVVRLGCYARSPGFFSGADPEQEARVENALEITGMTALRHADMLKLSGGETQRTFLAQVFAQDPRVLILDEPANHLDLKYQQHIFSLIQDWLKKPGRAVLSVVHDLSLAARYGTHAVLMDHGKSISQGPVRDVMTPENLHQVYGMDVYAWMQEMLSQWQPSAG